MEFDWKIVLCFTLWMLGAQTQSVLLENIGVPGVSPAPEFSKVSTIKPKLIHYREKRHISTTKVDEDGVEHLHDVTVVLNMNGRDQLLDLRLNRELIPKGYFEKHQKNGSYQTRRPNHEEMELCHYQGKLRASPDSWAAISTCHGLRGVVYDGKELHYLERATGSPEIHNVDHFLYSHSNLVSNFTCGYQGTDHSHINGLHEINRIRRRFKRSDEVIRGPYNANARSSYVELVLVMDNKEYKALGENMDKVNNHCKDIANIINALYVPLNIFIALVGVVVWTEYDEIALSANGDTTLTNFLHYRREKLVKEHPNDNAQLLTRIQFEGGVVGKALKGPICTFEFSGGVSMDHSAVVGLVATTVAHEMGHNFGMEHDSSDCQCPDDRCIMAPSSSSMSPTHWSSCSLEYLALAFEHGMDYCLRNKPTKLFDSPVCGNGFVEAGEQCDCGLKDHCDNPCCNPSTCMLFSNASCATGECCDLKTCRPKTVGTLCREATQECDLAEYCTGHSEFCPEDVFKMDGIKCNRGKAYCYKGSCRTHSDQCKLLWGPSGKSSDTQCYKMNKKGSRHGNCGYNRLNQSYIKCQDQDLQCGMLHCTHLNERLEFGMESVAILSHSFINSAGSIIPCRTAIVDLGLNEVDPGLAPDGARCGEGKMCVNQKCMSVENMWAGASVAHCPNNCNNNGVCNSRGHCHCNMGFAPPNCDYPGPGGSQDSGPASDPNARREFVIFLYVTFLGIVPFIAVVSLFVYYMKRNPTLWRKKPRIAMYVPWLFPCHSNTRTVDVFVVNPPTIKHSESLYCTVDGDTHNDNSGVEAFKTPFDNKTYFTSSGTIAHLSVRELTKNFEPESRKIGRPPPPPPLPIKHLDLSINNTFEARNMTTPPISPSGKSFNSDDTDDSWDSDPYSNSLYNTTDNIANTSQHAPKKSGLKNSKKAISRAKNCVRKGLKNMTFLRTKNIIDENQEQNYERPKIDIVKKDLLSTTNIQVQNMMNSSKSLINPNKIPGDPSQNAKIQSS